MIQYLVMIGLLITYIVVSLALSGAILMQGQGGGLGSAFGGTTAYHTRRGLEKSLFVFTIILAVIFTLVAVLVLI